MGRLKEFLIEEQMRITGNWREKDHTEYLAWRKKIEEEEKIYYEGSAKISRRDKQGNSKEDLG